MTATRHPTRRHVLALAGGAAALAGRGMAGPAVLSGAPPVRQMAGSAFACPWQVTLPDRADPEALRPGLAALLEVVDRGMSPWRADSEIAAFNRAGTGSLPVSGETALVARAALEVAEDSGGWFDPTVGPLVARWGFGPIAGTAPEPGAPPLWRGLAAEDGALEKAAPGLTLDLCGIAKGRALDLMAGRLAEAGQEHFLIDLGGELAARGRHPSGRTWQVAVEDPRPGRDGAAALLRLDGLAVATSGLKAQSYGPGGRRYGHIIDPHRAAPADGALASVSVLSDRAMPADAWATALMAAGEAGPDLARQAGLAALFLFTEGGELRAETTGGFDRHLLA